MQTIIQKYKSGKITIYELLYQLDLLRNKKKRKSEGVVYTPKYIADYIIQKIDYQLSETILEPSVGHGLFIFSLIEHVESKFQLNSNELKEWFENKVYGIDILKENIEDFKLLLKLYFNNKGIEISTNNFTVQDTLFSNLNKFDCIIGNPPYIRTKNLEENYLKKLRTNYITTEKGNVDIYYAFIEMAYKNANKISYIVPNSYIYNKSASNLRNLIKKDIVSIIDFKNTLIFDNANTYTSIFYINKKEENKFIGYKNKLDEKYKKVIKQELNPSQWIFNDNNTGKNTVEDFCNVKSGVATLKDKIFIIEDPKEIIKDNKKNIEQTYLGKSHLIEKEITVDYFKITKPNKSYKIIYPYNENSEILNEEYLKTKYPYAYSFLKEVRVDLDKRDKGKVDKYEAWYSYGRKQGLSKNNKAHYLLVPLMISKGFECKELKNPKHFLFASGFVLEFEDNDKLNYIKNIIESNKFYDFIKEQGKPWAGKKEYFSFTTTLLKKFKF